MDRHAPPTTRTYVVRQIDYGPVCMSIVMRSLL